MILRNESTSDNTYFKDISFEVTSGLEGIGLVTDAAWTDINLDGWDDLVIVGEWMSVRIFENHQGQLIEKTEQYGLDDTLGWWECIVPYDLDLDGDMDLVVGNLGLNYKYKASKGEPFKIYADDFDQNGKSGYRIGILQWGRTISTAWEGMFITADSLNKKEVWQLYIFFQS